MSQFFCLEPDRADGRPLGGGRGAKVVFELSATLADLSPVPAPGEALFPGYAKAQLAEIPQINSGSREFRNAVSVQVTLLRKFDDMVGHYGQVWDLSEDEARLAFAGQVSKQTAGVGTTTLTLSDLPVDSINAQVPAQIVEAENFPGTRDAGATVPVVVGRTLRHLCPHLSRGYEMLLERSAVAGGTTLHFKHDKLDEAALKKFFPVAVGDMLSVGIGEHGSDNALLTETARVAGVTLPDTGVPSVTLEKGLTNNHWFPAVFLLEGGASGGIYNSTYDAGTVREAWGPKAGLPSGGD